MSQTVSELLVGVLQQIGVKHIFGLWARRWLRPTACRRWTVRAR
jgi:hypothetical protein